jgi:hypothetical protein
LQQQTLQGILASIYSIPGPVSCVPQGMVKKDLPIHLFVISRMGFSPRYFRINFVERLRQLEELGLEPTSTIDSDKGASKGKLNFGTRRSFL